jgi:hypothetical protein
MGQISARITLQFDYVNHENQRGRRTVDSPRIKLTQVPEYYGPGNHWFLFGKAHDRNREERAFLLKRVRNLSIGISW